MNYLNDRALLMRSSRLDKPTYSIHRNVWPPRLERIFPGLLEAIKEKDPAGEEYISGERALDYLFSMLRKKVRSFQDDTVQPPGNQKEAPAGGGRGNSSWFLGDSCKASPGNPGGIPSDRLSLSASLSSAVAASVPGSFMTSS